MLRIFVLEVEVLCLSKYFFLGDKIAPSVTPWDTVVLKPLLGYLKHYEGYGDVESLNRELSRIKSRWRKIIFDFLPAVTRVGTAIFRPSKIILICK